MITFAGLTVAASAGVGVLAAKVDHAGQFFTYGASFATMLTLLGVPVWRAFRTARKERQHQTGMLTAVHSGMFGEAERQEDGVLISPAKPGLIDRVGGVEGRVAGLEQQFATGSQPLREIAAKLDRASEETTRRLDQHDERLARLDRTAGEAAVRAAATHDQMKQLSGRMWTWVNDLQVRADGLTAVVRELGVDVEDMPGPDDDGAA